MIDAILLLAMQSVYDPAAVPRVSSTQILACVPARHRNARSIEALPADVRRTAIGCWQALAARSVAAQLPARVDEQTVLVSVDANGIELRYHYIVDVAAADVTDGQRRAIAEDTRIRACMVADMRTTLQAGGAYRYVWRDRNGMLLQNLLIARC